MGIFTIMQKKNSFLGIFLIGCLFFIFGFITWSNTQLIPYLKLACQLNDTQSYYVATAFFAAYFFTSYPSSLLLKVIGFRKGMAWGLLIMALGAALFIPAAGMVSYPLFLTGLFIIGTGLAMLQTASNPYVTILGPMESAAKRMSIMGVCNKAAGIIAVYTLGAITLKDADNIQAGIARATGSERRLIVEVLAGKVIMPYIVITAVLILLALIIYRIMPEIGRGNDTVKQTASPYDKMPLLRIRHLVLGALAIFFYVGAEVLCYDTFSTFGQAAGYSLDEAKTFATYTGYALIAGYFAGIALIPKLISQRQALILSSLFSMGLVLLAMYTVDGTFSKEFPVVCFALLGFSNAAIWPAIWPLAIDKVGRHTEKGAALLVMMIVGGAVLPPLYGKLAAAIGSDIRAYWIMIPCYLYLLFYALWGSKPQRITGADNTVVRS